MAYFEIIMGNMFAGKTTELIKKIHMADDKYFVINSKIDDRSEKNTIMTHNKEKVSSIQATNLLDIVNQRDFLMSKYIFVDEAQFFDDLYKFATLCMNLEKKLYIAGLSGDFMQRPFGQILDCVPLADNVIIIKSRCYICDSEAPFTKRISDNQNQISVGGSDMYKPSCRKHLE